MPDVEHFDHILDSYEIDAIDVTPPAKKKLPHRPLTGGEFRNHNATLGKRRERTN
jgi:hypothetical protein